MNRITPHSMALALIVSLILLASGRGLAQAPTMDFDISPNGPDGLVLSLDGVPATAIPAIAW